MSSIFSPGEYFAGALNDFKAGTIKLGTTRIFKIGVDPVPTVKVCPSVDGSEEIQKQVDSLIDNIAAGKVDINAEISG